MNELLNKIQVLTSRHKAGTLAAVLLLVFLARLIIGGWLLFPDEPHRALYHDTWLRIAENLVQGNGYRVRADDALDVVRPPLFVYTLAAIISLFGVALWPVMLFNWMADVVTGWFLYRITLEVFPRQQIVALLAVMMWAFYVPEIVISTHALSEPLFTALLSGHIYALLLVRKSRSVGSAAICGLMLGAAVMTRSSAQLWLPFVWIALLINPARPFSFDLKWVKQMLVPLIIVSITYVLAIAPWTLRNQQISGTLRLSSVGAGQLLFQDNWLLDKEDRAVRIKGMDGKDEWVPALQLELQRRGEPYPTDRQGNADRFAIDKKTAQLGWEKIREYPQRYLEMCAYRFTKFWFNLGFGTTPSFASYMVALLNGGLMALAIGAVFLERRVWFRSALPIIMLIGYFTGLHTLLFSIARYSFPIIPYVMVFSAYSVWSVMSRYSAISHVHRE